VEPIGDIADTKRHQTLEKQREKAKRELQDIVVYYQTSDNIRPEIQRELRAKVGIFKTKAGLLIKDIWGEKEELSPPPTSWSDSFSNVVEWFSSRFWWGSSSAGS
jgi:hypothetical protein